ncbi:undecaprenyl-diphosphate phosphatase [Amphibiibacter pelophylacis]|uniref:Undecaprenyl-diphosphate phosphatase n=1 Tax=Amphibiibacter pelophylacis TaxID=1799477 RepID=A0ACC6P4K8_9BURK
MDMVLWIKAAVMGIVEGLTEFLPISSTGHLILAGHIIGFTGEMAKVFEIAIQTGAILAVMWVYKERITSTISGLSYEPKARRLTLNIVIAFIPAAVIGLVVGKLVKEYLFNPVSVASAFIIGGLIILAVERRQKNRGGDAAARIQSVDDMTPLDALKVGCLQCLALIPGTSRSGSTIIGGMWMGLSRAAATEFSFFLGIPTLLAAGAYSLLKNRDILHISDLPVFLIGTLFAFLSAMVCVRWLLRFVSTNTFTIFAWYRIAFGILVLVSAAFGVNWHEG